MKRAVLAVAVSAVVAVILPSLSVAAAPAAPPTVSTFALYGDAPYGNPTVINADGTITVDTAQFGKIPAFIDTINADPNVGGVIHVGDIHSGKQFCTEAYDRSIGGQWTRFQDPLVYTPGDNEWADCHKAAQGGHVSVNGQPVDYADGDPIANLALVRSLFFPTPGATLGSGTLHVTSQATAYDPSHPEDAQFVENVMWQQSDVVFVTINLPGGSNNDQDVWFAASTETAAQTQERTQRTAADVRWLDAAFALAKQTRAAGVLIVAQADMWDPEKGAAHQTGYEPIVQTVASDAKAFDGPVLMFNGDSHVYRSDNPLREKATCVWELAAPCVSVANMHPGYNVPNFHRIVVHGSTTPLEWLKLTVDPSADYPNRANAFGPFSWERETQPQL
jgi:hypothetical protein